MRARMWLNRVPKPSTRTHTPNQPPTITQWNTHLTHYPATHSIHNIFACQQDYNDGFNHLCYIIIWTHWFHLSHYQSSSTSPLSVVIYVSTISCHPRFHYQSSSTFPLSVVIHVSIISHHPGRSPLSVAIQVGLHYQSSSRLVSIISRHQGLQ